jgi:hypothetical protein
MSKSDRKLKQNARLAYMEIHSNSMLMTKKFDQEIFLVSAGIPLKASYECQGCQIFLGTIYQKCGKIYQMIARLPNAHTIFLIVINYSKWPEYITMFSIQRSSKIYPNWYFWSKKKPSGNPDECHGGHH